MADPPVAACLISAIRAGGEALDRGERGPRRELDLLREAGLLTAALTPELGGRGWGTTAAGVDAIRAVLMALGTASLPIARIYEGHVNAVRLIDRHGSPAQRSAMAEMVARGGLIAVWGADGAPPVERTCATGKASLAGTKAFASGLGEAGLAIVTFPTEAGPQMVLAAADDPRRASHERWDVDGMVGSRSGWFDCTGLPAGPGYLLGEPSAFVQEPDFHGGVWRLVAIYAGAMRRLAELAESAIETRPSDERQLARSRLGLITIEAETATLWSRAASYSAEANDCSDDGVATALLAREAVEQAAMRMLTLIERAAGATMHARTSELGRTARDLRFFMRQANLDGKLALATELRTAAWLRGRAAA